MLSTARPISTEALRLTPCPLSWISCAGRTVNRGTSLRPGRRHSSVRPSVRASLSPQDKVALFRRLFRCRDHVEGRGCRSRQEPRADGSRVLGQPGRNRPEQLGWQ